MLVYKTLKDQNKAGSFVNVATIQEREEGLTKVEENVNDILVRKENEYINWLCWSGQESLFIRDNGDVFNATCRVKYLENIYDDFDIPINQLFVKNNGVLVIPDLNTKAKDVESCKIFKDSCNEQ